MQYKTRTFLATASLCLGLLAVSSPAGAALFDRGGGLLYDSVLNITWLQDANYAKTSGYSVDGKMEWSNGKTWAESLVYHDTVRGVDWSDWRLAQNSPVNGTSFVDEPSFVDGSTDRPTCTTSIWD